MGLSGSLSSYALLLRFPRAPTESPSPVHPFLLPRRPSGFPFVLASECLRARRFGAQFPGGALAAKCRAIISCSREGDAGADSLARSDANDRRRAVISGTGVVAAAVACVLLLSTRRSALAVGGAANGELAVLRSGGAALGGAWPKIVQILQVLKEQGFILAALLGLSAFFSMAETAITTLWPWKVCNDTNSRPNPPNSSFDDILCPCVAAYDNFAFY